MRGRVYFKFGPVRNQPAERTPQGLTAIDQEKENPTALLAKLGKHNRRSLQNPTLSLLTSHGA